MSNHIITWKGEDQHNWRAEVGIDGNVPCIFDLSYETNGF